MFEETGHYSLYDIVSMQKCLTFQLSQNYAFTTSLNKDHIPGTNNCYYQVMENNIFCEKVLSGLKN